MKNYFKNLAIKIQCKVIGHHIITGAVHNKNSMRSTTLIKSTCMRCNKVLDARSLSKSQTKTRKNQLRRQRQQ